MTKLVSLSVLLGATVIVLFSFTLLQNDQFAASKKRGESVYATNCAACHQAKGEGIPGAIPPLAKADYLMADTKRAIRQVVHGFNGEMTVNGVKYNSAMPAQSHLKDQEIADVLNYVMNSWGNKNAKMVAAAQVKAERGKK
jgi:mono/diheme cytochrome c family protein